MSPTEDDLRRSLAAGSDDATDGVDAGRVIALAHQRHARRRTRVLSVAAAVVVVGGVATGIGFLAGHNGDQASDSSGGGTSEQAAGTGSAAGANRGASIRNPASATLGGPAEKFATCPSAPPSTLLPGGGGTNEFGSGGELFAKPASTVTVCAYPSQGGSTRPRQIHLSGPTATTFVRSLENAAKTRPKAYCSDLREADQQTLAILSIAKDNTQQRTVTTTINEPACAVIVTNGTAIRYDWIWPTSLDAQLTELLH